MTNLHSAPTGRPDILPTYGARMIDVTPLAVPYTLARLRPVLPPPPARILEVGCGRGALATVLAEAGYQVVGVEPDEEAAAVAAGRGVRILPVPVLEVPPDERCDVLLFTRSLHHVEGLTESVAHAVGLVEPGGLVVLEEFARERADRAAAGFVYDMRALLVAVGAVEEHEHAQPVDPSADPLDRWEHERGALSEEPLHTGEEMLAALRAAGGTDLASTDTETLWRMIVPPGTTWTGGEPVAQAVSKWARRVELRRIEEGSLPRIGMFVTASAAGR